MGFREEKDGVRKPVDVKEFGIGSVIMMDGSSMDKAFLICSTPTLGSIYAINLRTFEAWILSVKPKNPYHFTREEAYSMFEELRNSFDICATYSDGGWRSSGLKTLKLEYADD